MCGNGSALAAFIRHILFTVSEATVVGNLGQDLDQDRSGNGVLGRLAKVELERPGDSGHAVEKGSGHQGEVLAVLVPSP